MVWDHLFSAFAKFSEILISPLPPLPRYAHLRFAYQGVINVSFSENSAYVLNRWSLADVFFESISSKFSQIKMKILPTRHKTIVNQRFMGWANINELCKNSARSIFWQNRMNVVLLFSSVEIGKCKYRGTCKSRDKNKKFCSSYILFILILYLWT